MPWFAVMVPPAFGFWLVAGDLLGVPPADFRILLAASMLAVGLATLVQVTAGYMLPIFEGPAGNYLAAIAILAVSSPTPAQASGGLLAAGAIVLVLGLLRVDRMLSRLFTPPVVQVFLLMIVVIAMPPTIGRALELEEARFGTAAGWLSAGVVLVTAVALTRVARWRPYSLLVALIAGVVVYFLIDGTPNPNFESGGVVAPQVFPWGSPEISLSIVAPFAIAAALAAFNTIASIRTMATSIGRPALPEAPRRGLLVDGGAQCVNACLGNLLGHVPRLDSAGVVKLIGNPRSIALALAAVAVIALSLFGPVIDVLAMLPVTVSASVLIVVLGVLALQGLRQVAAMDRRSRWLVFTPAAVPCLVWLPLAESLPETLQLITNPLLVGTVLAVLLDRLIPEDTLGQQA